MSKIEAHLFGFSNSGFEMPQLIVRAETAQELADTLHALKAAGITVAPPDPAEVTGEKTETITCVVKRMHVGKDNRETPVVDFYPSWQGEYGQYRFVGVYLNTPEQVAEFEQHSGLKLADMPLYDSQAPLQRSASRRNKAEIDCTPFTARKLPDGEKVIDGKPQIVWKFAGYAEAAAQPNGTHGSNGNGSSTTFTAPPWWNAVLKVAIPQFYNGVQQHATHSVKKLLAEGKLTAQMTAEQVLAFLKARWEAEDVDTFPESEQPPARDYSDIPF